MNVPQDHAFILAVAATRYTRRPDADHALIHADHIAVLCRPLSDDRRATIAAILTQRADVLGPRNSAASDLPAPWHALIALLATEAAQPAAEVEVADTILRPVVTAAVRYALGRATYIVPTICGVVRNLAAGLGSDCLAALGTEIRAAASREQLGGSMDHRDWLDLAAWIDDHTA